VTLKLLAGTPILDVKPRLERSHMRADGGPAEHHLASAPLTAQGANWSRVG
jgi:tRNA (Thr-GGU) A37 N-methylase